MGTFNSLQYKELVVPIIWQVYLEETKCGDATTQTVLLLLQYVFSPLFVSIFRLLYIAGQSTYAYSFLHKLNEVCRKHTHWINGYV